MASFSLSFGGVTVRIVPSPATGGDSSDGEGSASSSKKDAFSIGGMRRLEDGGVEADVVNFTGRIVISSEGSCASRDGSGGEARVDRRGGATDGPIEGCASAGGDIVVDAVPERERSFASLASSTRLCKDEKIEQAPSLEQHPSNSADGEETNASLTNEPRGSGAGERIMDHQVSFMTEDEPELFVPPLPMQQLTVDINGGGGPANGTGNLTGHRVGFNLANNEIIPTHEAGADLSLHEACASDEIDINELRELLRKKPQLASTRDEVGDYPAHIFADNDAFIYTDCDLEVREFVMELYRAHPGAFLSEGYCGRIPFAAAIMDWVDDCHTIYSRDPTNRSVVRVSEIKTLTKSTRVINSLCTKNDVQRLLHLPTMVRVPVKVSYSLQMLSHILDALSELALNEISMRREFYATASRRRERIISSVASIPFFVRTLLLIEDESERNALLGLSVVRNAIFRPESVDMWLVALLSGEERARCCAVHYLCIISRSDLSSMFGARLEWSQEDWRRFGSQRELLYREIRKLDGFLPCMLHLGDRLYEVSTRRAIKYAVESTVGRPLAVYVLFLEMFMLLILMTSYRIIVEVLWALPNDPSMTQHRSLWGLAFSIAILFAFRDVTLIVAFAWMEEKLACRYASSFGNIVGYVTTLSVIATLSVIHITKSVRGRQFTGIVTGLLWWRFLLHVKGVNKNLSTLIYTIMQIALKLKYFLFIFLIAIAFFADMIDIVKKTSGECDYHYADAEMDSGLETFCSLTPLQSYLAMYGVMIGGLDISVLEGSSPLVSLLFVAASFSGVIVLVNILIAIVTGEYEKAQEHSSMLFARARLEEAARQAARDKIFNPPDDPNVWRRFWKEGKKIDVTGSIVLVEYFLIKSLLSCSSLHKDGVLGDFLYVALILCAALYNLILVAAAMYLLARLICRWETLQWLRGSKFHTALLKIGLLPVCRYLTSVGLGMGASCSDDCEEDDAPLSRNEFLSKSRHTMKPHFPAPMVSGSPWKVAPSGSSGVNPRASWLY